MRKVKGISFTEKDKKILEFLNEQPNASQYVINLIKEDMQGKERFIEDTVKKILDQYIKSGKIDFKEQQKNIKATPMAKRMLKNLE